MAVLNEFHFRLLASFLDHVKAKGGDTESDGILAVDGQFISPLSHGMEGPVTSAIKILRTLKDLHMTLDALREAVDYGLSEAQKKLLPVTRHHGILSLPLEIIAQIFRQVYDDDADRTTQSIPLVNHYFRNIAIAMPGLWTRLTPKRNPRLFVERSKYLGLEVDLVTVRGPHYRRFLEMVSPEAERWTSLMILTKRDLDEEDFEWTRDVLAGKTFTALRELRMEGSDRYYGSLKDQDPLCSDWKLPSLRLVKSKNVLPSIHPASLTGLHLHVGDPPRHSLDTIIDLDEIMTFLQTVPSLTELSFEIGWFRTGTFRTGTDVTLPNVKTLRLSVKTLAEGGAGLSFTNFLASLLIPNLSNLSVDATTKFASELMCLTCDMFPKGNSFWPSLESLDLSMSYDLRGTHFDFDNKMLGTSVRCDLLERIPAVRHLSIRAVDVDSPYPADWNVPLGNLQTLCFRDCNKFDTRFIRDIRRIFEAPGFETLKIHNCTEIDTETVRKMMPEGKAFVSTVDWNADITRL